MWQMEKLMLSLEKVQSHKTVAENAGFKELGFSLHHIILILEKSPWNKTDTHTGTELLFAPLSWIHSFALRCVSLVPLPSHPLHSFFLNLFSHHEIHFFQHFAQIQLGGSYTPLFDLLIIPSSLFISGLYEYIYMDRIKKSKIDFPFLSLPPSCLPKPQRVKTWASPTSQNTCILFVWGSCRSNRQYLIAHTDVCWVYSL